MMSLLPVLVNKGLLKHNLAHSLTFLPWLFLLKAAELSKCSRGFIEQSLRSLLSSPLWFFVDSYSRSSTNQ